MSAMTTIKPEHPANEAYYKTLKDMQQQQALHEGSVLKAFEHLLEETARLKLWTLVLEHSERATHSPRLDGASVRLPADFTVAPSALRKERLKKRVFPPLATQWRGLGR